MTEANQRVYKPRARPLEMTSAAGSPRQRQVDGAPIGKPELIYVKPVEFCDRRLNARGSCGTVCSKQAFVRQPPLRPDCDSSPAKASTRGTQYISKCVGFVGSSHPCRLSLCLNCLQSYLLILGCAKLLCTDVREQRLRCITWGTSTCRPGMCRVWR